MRNTIHELPAEEGRKVEMPATRLADRKIRLELTNRFERGDANIPKAQRPGRLDQPFVCDPSAGIEKVAGQPTVRIPATPCGLRVEKLGSDLRIKGEKVKRERGEGLRDPRGLKRARDDRHRRRMIKGPLTMKSARKHESPLGVLEEAAG